VPLNLVATDGEYVDIVGADAVAIFREESPPRDPVFAPCFVSLLHKGVRERIDSGNITDHRQEIDHRLRRQPRHRGAADVMDVN
jgi:hypothetical protein